VTLYEQQIKQRKMKYFGHIKRHEGLEKRIMEPKGDGFRISQMICKGMQGILLMIEWSSERVSREEKSDRVRLLNEWSSEGLSRDQSSDRDRLLNEYNAVVVPFQSDTFDFIMRGLHSHADACFLLLGWATCADHYEKLKQGMDQL
jgi:hypothetical protein